MRSTFFKILPNTTVFGLSERDERFLRAREDFVEKYCLKMGWDIRNLTIQQVMEIRAQEGWKNPQGAKSV
jgi:hypothetical protein